LIFFSLPFPPAGVFCAIVSHPADSVVSVLNKEKGSTASQVLQRLGFRGESGSPETAAHCARGEVGGARALMSPL
jgi:hypothetical protein